MIIRPATSKDYSEIVNICNHAVDEKFATADTEDVSVESRKEWFAQHGTGRDWTLFALVDGTVNFDRSKRQINVVAEAAAPAGN